MEESRRYGITKLGDNNYHIWQQRTELWLRKEDLWDVIEDITPAAPDSQWLKRDRQARATIGLLIDDKFLPDIKHERSAKNAWHKLKTIHSHHSLGARLMMYRRIFSARYTPGTNMIDHLTGILETASRLEDAGYKILDEVLCGALLVSLPRDYDTLITTIEGRNEKDITTEYVRQKILEEYQKKDRYAHTQPQDSKALFSSSRANQHRSKSFKCYYCHKVGHVRKDCRLLKNHNAHGEFTKKTPPKSSEQSRIMGYDFHPTSEPVPTPERKTPEKQNDSSTYRALNTHIAPTELDDSTWVIDTGAAEHMCCHLHQLRNVTEVDSPTIVITASGEKHKVEKKGDFNLMLRDKLGNQSTILLTGVLHLPSLTENLLSIARLDEDNYTITFTKGESWIAKEGKSMLLGEMKNKLYIYHPTMIVTPEKSNLCSHIWHTRLGHRNKRDIERMAKENMTEDLKISTCHNPDQCTSCNLGKMPNAPFRTSNHKKATGPFQVIVSDLCGPITPESLGHNSYILTFTDEYSKFTSTYMLKHKDDTAEAVVDYVEKGKNKFNRRPITFFSDGGGEFNNHKLDKYFSKQGVRHLNSLPYRPQENGRAERYNRTLLDATRTLLNQARLPDYLWAEIASTATYLINLSGSRDLQLTPFELWHGQKPKVTHLRTIGTTCFFLNPQPHKKKLDDRGLSGTLIGYGESTSFYRIWDSSTNRVYQSRKVIFPEEVCPQQPKAVDIPPQHEQPLNNVEQSTATEEETPRRSTRHNLGRAPKILTYSNMGEPSPAPRDWFNQAQTVSESQ